MCGGLGNRGGGGHLRPPDRCDWWHMSTACRDRILFNRLVSTKRWAGPPADQRHVDCGKRVASGSVGFSHGLLANGLDDAVGMESPISME